MEQSSKKILQQLKTTQNLNAFLHLLSEYKNGIYMFGAESNHIYDKYPRAAVVALEEYLAEHGGERTAGNSLNDTVKLLSGDLENIKPIYMTLAFTPSNEFIEELYELMLLELPVPFIFDMKIDETLIAGALISYGGRLYDGSVGQKLSKAFLESVQ